MIECVYTIGAYGFTEDSFHGALRDAAVDLFIDVRARRGMRGRAYAFANAKRLQESLERAGIVYVHARALAPTQAIRQAQWRADAEARVAKRDRTTLSGEFVAAYESECLHDFDPRRLVDESVGGATRLALFCVEREAAACHRSLVAPRFAQAFGVRIENLAP